MKNDLELFDEVERRRSYEMMARLLQNLFTNLRIFQRAEEQLRRFSARLEIFRRQNTEVLHPSPRVMSRHVAVLAVAVAAYFLDFAVYGQVARYIVSQVLPPTPILFALLATIVRASFPLVIVAGELGLAHYIHTYKSKESDRHSPKAAAAIEIGGIILTLAISAMVVSSDAAESVVESTAGEGIGYRQAIFLLLAAATAVLHLVLLLGGKIGAEARVYWLARVRRWKLELSYQRREDEVTVTREPVDVVVATLKRHADAHEEEFGEEPQMGPIPRDVAETLRKLYGHHGSVVDSDAPSNPSDPGMFLP